MLSIRCTSLATANLPRFTQRFCKEVITWNALSHPNVLPLLGMTMGSQEFVLVSEWMENGNINEFIKAHKDVDRFELVRFRFSLCPHTPPTNFNSSKTSLAGWHICTIKE